MLNVKSYRLSKVNLTKGWKSEESARIFEYYKCNSHKGNRLRDPLEMVETMKDGAFYLIEDSERNIVGASASFYYYDSFVEAGGTRITLGGYGLQKIFHWVRLLDFKIFEQKNTTYCSLVADWNENSIRNIEKTGFSEWSPSNAELTMIGKTTSDHEDRKAIRYYKMPQDKIEAAADAAALNVLHLNENPIVKSKYHNEQMAFALDIKLVENSDLRQILQEMSDRATLNGVKPLKFDT